MVFGLLLLLIAFHLISNWLWRQSNEVIFGLDRMYHQVTSLAYYDILRDGLSPVTLFSALTWSDYYPPLVHLTAAAFYVPFGISMDVAAMSNSLFLVLFLLAVYGLGEKLAGPWVGLLSALIVSTFPIVFSMSRYLYVDFALTAMVALNICLLLRSDRFRHQGYALLYGVSLGLGMLTKWTFVTFTVAPFLVMVARSDVLRPAWRALPPNNWNLRRLLASGLLSLVVTALWFVPNIEATAALPLSYALVPLSWLLWAATLYFALSPSDRGSNLLAALGLGICLASSWYLTKINFVGGFWQNAYGKSTGRSWGFVPYLEFLYREQLSPLYAVVVVVAILGLIWRRWHQTRSWRSVFALPAEGWALVLWAVVPFLIFSSQASIIHSRYIMPLLPPLAIAVALWLIAVRPRWVRGFLIGMIGVSAAFQFSALSYDALADLQARIPYLADGLSIQLPSSGRTDPGYWVVPDILDYIEARRDTDPAQLGMLVNTQRVNSKQFIYMVYDEYPHIQVNELAEIGWEPTSYPGLFESDFVLLKDPPPRYARRPDTKATIERLLTTADDTFHRAYALAQVYPLPNDTRLLLYQRRLPTAQGPDLAHYEALMADLAHMAQPEDGVVVFPAEQVYALARFGDGSFPIYPLPPEPGAFSETDTSTLEHLGTKHQRLWVVLGETADNASLGTMSDWLANHFYRAYDAWYGPLQLVLYAPSAGLERIGEFHDSHTKYLRYTPQAVWENGISLMRYRLHDSSLLPGQVLRLDLQWQTSEPIPERYKAFLHLLSQEGELVSQRDSEPVNGFRPTTTWQPGESITDRYGLWLPANLREGDYQIRLGLYHSETGERLPVCCPASDSILLAHVRAEGNEAHVLPGP